MDDSVSADFPDLTRYSATPRYNIKAVERATGLSPRTLRSWERRYGTPAPQRDTRGRRLYSERDIAIIRWLMERVGQGVAVSRAVAMLSEVGEGTRIGEAPASPSLDKLQLRLLQAIDWMDEDEVARVLAQAFDAAALETVVLELIRPVFFRMGDLWAAGHLSAASEHFGTHMLRSALTELFRRGPEPTRSERVIIGSAPSELHDVGALLFAIFLRRAGFPVMFLGANLDGETLLADLQRLQPAAVGLSASTAAAAGALATLYQRLAAGYRGVLVYGGAAFRDSPEARENIPGTYLGPEVHGAAETLAAMLEAPSPAVPGDQEEAMPPPAAPV